MASGSGESGRERVGDGVPTAKLLLLLLRALKDTKKKREICKGETQSVTTCVIHEHNKQSGREKKTPTSGIHADHSRGTIKVVYVTMMVFIRKHVCKHITERVWTVSWLVDVTTSQRH